MSDKATAPITEPNSADAAGADDDGPREIISPFRQALRERAAGGPPSGEGAGEGKGAGEGEEGKGTGEGEEGKGAGEGEEGKGAGEGEEGKGAGEGEGEGEGTGEGTGEGEGEGAGEGEGEGAGEGEEIVSLTELVADQGWDPEWVDQLEVNVKINGARKTVSLKDAIDSYQIQEAATARLDEAKGEAKALTEQVHKRAEQELSDDMSDDEMQKLRISDPGEYAARQGEFTRRQDRIENLKAEAVQSWHKGQADVADTMKNQTAERAAQEADALVEKIPEWGDAKKAETGIAKLTDYLVGEGFTSDDVKQASDHKLIVLAEKARRWDALQASADKAVKKVAKVPRTLKPGPKGSTDRQPPKDPATMTMDEYAIYRKNQGAPIRV